MSMVERIKREINERKHLRIYKKKLFQRKGDEPNHCAKCNMPMRENDKYCEYCGTKKGLGVFFPYKNRLPYLYGSPMKRKYKCTKCGHLWIDHSVGIGDARYCPNCKGKVLTRLSRQSYWEPNWHWFAYEEPFEEVNRPILFTEDEVNRLCQIRPLVSNINKTNRHASLSDRDVFDAMKQAGFDLPETMYDKNNKKHIFPLTEKEDEQILLATQILKSKGNNLRGFPSIRCPHCNNDLIAAISYTVVTKGFKKIEEDLHVPTSPDAIIWHDHDRWKLGGNFWYEDFYPFTYLCLRCGKRFGEFNQEIVSKLQEKADSIEHEK